MKKYILAMIGLLSLIVCITAFPRSTSTKVYLTGGVEPVGEVWLTNIEINGQKDTPRDYPVSGNWRYVDKSIVYTTGNPDDGNTLELEFKNAESIQLTFMKHNWSGGIGISDGEQYTEINLWDQSGSVVYDVKNIIPPELNLSGVILSALGLSVLLLLLYGKCQHDRNGLQKLNKYDWGLVAVHTIIWCRLANALFEIGFVLFTFVMIYLLFIRNRISKNMVYHISVVIGFAYSLYQFINPTLPDAKVVLGFLLLLEGFYSLELGKGSCWSRWAVITVSPVLCFFMIECISNVDILQLSIPMAVVGTGIIACFLFITVNILCFKNLGWYIAFLSAFIISAGNYFVILFKKYALTFGDLRQIRTAVTVVGDYQYDLSNGIVYGFLILVLLISMVHVYLPAQPLTIEKIRKRMAVGASVAVLQIGVIYLIDFQQTFHIVWNNWDTAQTYSKYGFVVSFITSAQRMMIEKPEGYSNESVEEILKDYAPERIEYEGEKPVIIAIMNESFGDLTDLGSLGETEDVMWYMNSLDDYLEKGKTLVSVRGGGTCNSEFEFLTGNSMEMFKDLYPYTQYNFSNITSLTSVLKEQGYKTVAMHPAEPENYRRQGVYKEMGFDEFYSYDSYQQYKKVFLDRTSDMDDYREILKQIEKSNKYEALFIFNVTIQNHGDFDMEQFDPSYERISMDPELKQYESAWMYLSLIKESNHALKYLIEELKKVDRPVILCMFGDHQVGCLSSEFEEKIFDWDENRSELANKQRYYTTPYLIWANYDVNSEGIQKEEQLTSPNYLASKILKYAGIETTEWYRFLFEMQKEVPAINRFGYLGSDGVWYDFDQESAYEKWIHDYRILQYDQVVQSQ